MYSLLKKRKKRREKTQQLSRKEKRRKRSPSLSWSRSLALWTGGKKEKGMS